MENTFMQKTLAIARRSMQNQGGPFGALIVKEGKIIGEGSNQVTQSQDPTQHAEIVAIRQACQTLKHFSLEGCTLYTSCEPCPMCLGAIYWAKIDKIYYAGTRHMAELAGFADNLIYTELCKALHQRQIPMEQVLADEAACVLDEWVKLADKVSY
jgi:guanine deaminase